MEPAVKDALLERFRAYLEQAEEASFAEAPKAPDLFSILAELAAVKNEVKLESRQVKAALDQITEVFDTLRQAHARLNEELNRQREQAARARDDEERDLLLELVELRDRIQAAHDQAERYRPGWLRRRGKAARFVAGMAEGLGMNLLRLDEMLARHGVHTVPALHQPFDPQTMHTVGIEHDPRYGEGLVVGELRTGFIHRGRLLRAADVIVNRKDEPS